MRTILSIAAAVAATGCGFHASNSTDGGNGDGRDGPPPSVDAQMCFGAPAAWSVCLTSLPTDQVALPALLDTTAGNFAGCRADDSWGIAQPRACIVSAKTIVVPGGTVVTGDRPLVLVATDTITVAGSFDASSRSNSPTSHGPGANSTFCQTATTVPGNQGNVGGGGAGGSFVTRGANGGSGDGGGSTAGQASATTGAPMLLRGGCPGQTGADGSGQGGFRGDGGGALYLVAGNSIVLSAAADINVSGGAGHGGGAAAGGGGGGSGGMIVLQAPTIDVRAGSKLVANGGGGASGSSNGTAGTTGTDPDPQNPMTQAAPTTGAGGTGMPGAAGTNGPVAGGAGGSNKGGGGGGGAFGYIVANKTIVTTSSPSVTSGP